MHLDPVTGHPPRGSPDHRHDAGLQGLGQTRTSSTVHHLSELVVLLVGSVGKFSWMTSISRALREFRPIRRHRNKNRTDSCLQSNQQARNIDVLDASLTAGDASES